MQTRLALIPVLALLVAIASSAAAQSRRGELRGAWMSEGYDRDWPAIMQSLHDNGFNAFFPCFSIGNMALYPSRVLAPAPARGPTPARGATPARDDTPRGDPDRDELAEAAAAARANGIELHVWRINWALWQTPKELLDQFEAEGRLQRNSKGELARANPDIKVDWLCPSHPENRTLEKEAMLELVRDYDVAGIHFDYMRFPGGDYCFCDGCKERFQQQSGATVTTWPDDVMGDGALAGKWRQWRRDLMTSLVEEIADAAHAIKPDVSVSLAAWDDIEDGREEYGQDWIAWSRDGLLDFVCPMDYTRDTEHLTDHLTEQLSLTRSAIPLYAGLGGFRLKSSVDLIEQIEAARAAGADGFVIFSYRNRKLVPWLPDLRATVTAADPAPMPHGHPPASFAFSGEAVAPPAEANRVMAGARLEAEIALGWEPPTLPEDDSAAAAAQAGAMLERALDVRDPVGSYDSRPGLAASLGDEERLTGRVVVESPQGAARLLLGPFDTAYQFSRTLGFPAPEGAFRIAIYGTLKTPTGARDFVVRSPLLVGVSKDDLQAEALRADLEKLAADACSRPEVARLAPLAIRLHATDLAGGKWWLVLKAEGCETGAGSIESPDLTVSASAADFLSLARGEASPKVLWETGRLDITGEDQLIARLIALYSGE